MKNLGRKELITINVVLLALLAGLLLWPAAHSLWSGSTLLAQPARARGQYLVVSGTMTGPSSHAIYIMDTANMEMVALRWEQSKNDFVGLGYRNIGEDAHVGGGGR